MVAVKLRTDLVDLLCRIFGVRKWNGSCHSWPSLGVLTFDFNVVAVVFTRSTTATTPPPCPPSLQFLSISSQVHYILLLANFLVGLATRGGGMEVEWVFRWC